MTPDASLRTEHGTVRALELADFLLIAEAVLEIPAKRIAEESSLHLADSALHAPLACFGGEDFYPEFARRPPCSARTWSRTIRSGTATRRWRSSPPSNSVSATAIRGRRRPATRTAR